MSISHIFPFLATIEVRSCLAAGLVAVVLVVTAGGVAHAETVKATATPDGRVIGFVVPLDDGIVSLTAIAKKARTWALAAISSDGEVFWCFAIAGRDRALRCDFQVQAFADIAIVAVSSGGSVKFDLNVDGPSDEPVLRTAAARQRESAPAAVDAVVRALRNRLEEGR
jgi:hypothetical protein